MKINGLYIPFFLIFATVANAQAESVPELKDGWELGFFLGTAYSKDETLTIKQDGYPDITFDASFETKPFDSPPYYAIRVGKWNQGHAFELEHIHHKLYVDDLPADVQHFEVTDGYNLFFFNSAWQLNKVDLIARAGLGVVIAHPQITVRNMTNYQSGGGAIPLVWDSESGYQWAGPAIQASLEKEFRLNKNWLLSLEGKISHANADIDIEGGSVEVPNTSVHLLGGVKYDF